MTASVVVVVTRNRLEVDVRGLDWMGSAGRGSAALQGPGAWGGKSGSSNNIVAAIVMIR